MNNFQGEISDVKTNGNLSIVVIKVKNINFKSIVLETSNSTDYLILGNKINLFFKETEVVVGIGSTHQVSLQNKIPGSIKAIEKGALLSKLIIDTEIGKIIAIITTDSVKTLNFEVGVQVTAMIKTNEIMLSK